MYMYMVVYSGAAPPPPPPAHLSNEPLSLSHEVAGSPVVHRVRGIVGHGVLAHENKVSPELVDTGVLVAGQFGCHGAEVHGVLY